MDAYKAIPAPSAALLAVCLIMAGCGFQLRGVEAAPEALKPLALECDQSVPLPLCAGVRQQLSAYDMLAEGGEPSSYRLRLSDYQQHRRVSAITERAAAAEYELTSELRVSLRTPDDIPLLARASVQATEVYRSDETRVLVEESERSGVERGLYGRLVQQVISRLKPFDEERILLIREAYPTQDSNEAQTGMPHEG